MGMRPRHVWWKEVGGVDSDEFCIEDHSIFYEDPSTSFSKFSSMEGVITMATRPAGVCVYGHVGH